MEYAFFYSEASVELVLRYWSLSDKYSTNLWLSYKCTLFPGFTRDRHGYFAFPMLFISSWSPITSLLETLDVWDSHLNWKYTFNFPQCHLWSSLASPLWALFPSRSQWLRFYFHRWQMCSSTDVAAVLLSHQLSLAATKISLYCSPMPKCHDTLNKMAITTSSLSFTLPTKHFHPTNKQSKMYPDL